MYLRTSANCSGVTGSTFRSSSSAIALAAQGMHRKRCPAGCCTADAAAASGEDMRASSLQLVFIRRSGSSLVAASCSLRLSGVRAIEDVRVVAELSERGIVLECCPTSNVVLGVFASYAEHPLAQLAAAGVRVTLGSDDPPYFGASIGGEYEIARERLGFDEDDLKAITATAIDAAFCDDGLKTALRERAAKL